MVGNGLWMVWNGLEWSMDGPGMVWDGLEWSGNAPGMAGNGASSQDPTLFPQNPPGEAVAAPSGVFYHSQTFSGEGNKVSWSSSIPSFPWEGEQGFLSFDHSHLSSCSCLVPIPSLPLRWDPSQSHLIPVPGVLSRQGFGCCPPAMVGRRLSCCCSCSFPGGEGPAFPGNPAEQDLEPRLLGEGIPGEPSPAPRAPRGTKNVTALFPSFPGSFQFGRLWIFIFCFWIFSVRKNWVFLIQPDFRIPPQEFPGGGEGGKKGEFSGKIHLLPGVVARL